jgi:hypothetical protein
VAVEAEAGVEEAGAVEATAVQAEETIDGKKIRATDLVDRHSPHSKRWNKRNGLE